MTRFKNLNKMRSINIRNHHLGFIPDFRDIAKRTTFTELTILADHPFNTKCDSSFCWIWKMSNRYDIFLTFKAGVPLEILKIDF